MFGLVVTAVRALPRPGGGGEDGLAALASLATIVAVVIVGAFDAVMLLPTPSAVFWPALGALAPVAATRIVVPAPRPLRMLAAGAVLVCGLVAVAHSVAQLVAMDLYGDGTRVGAVEAAVRWDPGSYRIQERLAEIDVRRGRCPVARARAERARRLFPSAPAPRRVLAECRQ
jgi:hypothetical protein